MASSPSSSSSPAPAAESSEAFEQRIMETVTSGALVPCIAVGSKLGLFNKMAEFKQPITSQELSDAMNYKERYVREWLNSMVCLRVFDYDEAAKTYFFPENRHPLFTDKGGLKNIAEYTQGLPLVSGVYPELQDCFAKDGPLGIPYEKYIGFHDWLEGRNKLQFSEDYIRGMFVRVPGLVQKLESGISVCDMGCGTSYQTRQIARMFPKSTVHGCDIGADVIQQAKDTSANDNLSNLSYSVQDVCNLPADWSESFDLVVVFDVIHDLPYASKALKAIRRSLKPGGLFYMMDVASKENPTENIGILYSVSLFHCMAQSLYHEGSEGLGTSWGNVKAKEMLNAAGFSSITDLQSPDDTFSMHMVCDK